MEDQCTSSSPLDLEDIEDMFGDENLNPRNSRNKENVVVPKVKKRRSTLAPIMDHGGVLNATETGQQSSFLPGTQSVYLKTWGCTHNSSDSEYMAGQLAQQGYK